MLLTPVEIRNVAFSKPPRGRRGFDAEEVDAFLDEVGQELARLLEENAELRTRLGGRGVPTGPDADQRLAAELAEVKAQLDRDQRARDAAEDTARAVEAELERLSAQDGPTNGTDEQALGMLMMAQRTADDHIAEARREADQVLSDAQLRAEQLTGEARTNADMLVRNARQQHQEAMAGLDIKRTATLKEIEELRRFIRTYRAQLNSHLEGKVRNLEGRRDQPEAQPSEAGRR